MDIEKLIDAIGSVDDEMITEYANGNRRKRRLSLFIKVAAAAAFIPAVLGAFIFLRTSSLKSEGRRHSIPLVFSRYAAGSDAAYAKDVKVLFESYLGTGDDFLKTGEYPGIGGNVEVNIYEEETEHLKFEILEQLYDGLRMLLTVRYTALDEKGREFLDNNFVVRTEIDGSRYTHFVRQGWGINWDETLNKYEFDSFGPVLMPDKEKGYIVQSEGGMLRELYNLSNGNERYFLMLCENSSPDIPEGQKMVMRYPVVWGCRSFYLDKDIKQLDFAEYGLEPVKEDEAHKDIKTLRLSGISFVVGSDNTEKEYQGTNNVPVKAELFIKNDEARFISPYVIIWPVKEDQGARDYIGYVYSGYFCLHSEEDKRPVRDKWGFTKSEYYAPDDPTGHERDIYCFDKDGAEKIRLTWPDGTQSEYICRK